MSEFDAVATEVLPSSLPPELVAGLVAGLAEWAGLGAEGLGAPSLPPMLAEVWAELAAASPLAGLLVGLLGSAVLLVGLLVGLLGPAVLLVGLLVGLLGPAVLSAVLSAVLLAGLSAGLVLSLSLMEWRKPRTASPRSLPSERSFFVPNKSTTMPSISNKDQIETPLITVGDGVVGLGEGIS